MRIDIHDYTVASHSFIKEQYEENKFNAYDRERLIHEALYWHNCMIGISEDYESLLEVKLYRFFSGLWYKSFIHRIIEFYRAKYYLKRGITEW